MKILYYHWNENSSLDIEDAFSSLGYSYTKVSYPLNSYDSDSSFETKMHELLSSQCFDCIYTFDYFPILSDIAEKHKIPYIAWIYDCPHLTLYSHTIRNSCNYLFLFDKAMLNTVTALGAKYAFHMPLAVNTKRINKQLQIGKERSLVPFDSDVSFVGSLYEKTPYHQIQYLPDTLKGYFDGIMQAQQKIWGYNFIEELLTDDILEQALPYLKFEESPAYSYSAKTLLANILEQKITSDERIRLLNHAAEFYSVDIYTNSDKSILKSGKVHGAISYSDTMPFIFLRSKINLNISLRSISSGIPLRCLDILGCKGFLLSNYQPELAELFVPGEEFVYFESEEDLIDKIDYYLHHEAKRIEIACNGWAKIQEQFSYELLLSKIFKQVF